MLTYTDDAAHLPPAAAHAASEIDDQSLADEVAATRRTLRALDVVSAVLVTVVALAFVLLLAHVFGRIT